MKALTEKIGVVSIATTILSGAVMILCAIVLPAVPAAVGFAFGASAATLTLCLVLHTHCEFLTIAYNARTEQLESFFKNGH
jgi:hypothetical protein